MKRRRVLQSLAALPAVATLPRPALAQMAAAPASPAPPLPKLPLTSPSLVAEPAAKFFTPDQYAALAKLGQFIVPASGGNPGAIEAGAPQFLDFLLSQSPAPRQALYRNGLDHLNQEARRRYGQAFAALAPEQADTLLGALKAPWTYQGPTEPFARFLLAAKQDLFQATVNSREWLTSPNRRRGGGMGSYWYPIES